MPKAARNFSDYKMDLEWREIFGSSIDLTGCMVDILESFNMATEGSDIGQPPDETLPNRKGLSPLEYEALSVDSTHTCFSGDSGFNDLDRNSIWRNSSSSSGSAASSASHQLALSLTSCHDDPPDEAIVPVHPRRTSLSLGSKTHFIIDEVIQTEKNYVEDLRQIWQGYLQPMRQSPLFSSEDLNLVFANLEDILGFHKEFFSVLLMPDLTGPAYLAERFNQHADDFEIYAEYCINFPASVKHLAQLNRGHPDWFRAHQTDIGHSLQLATYLLKPIQRILKYHLLLQKLLDNCDSEAPGYQCVGRAYESMRNIAQKINELQNQKERKIRLEELELLLQDLPANLSLTDFGELLLDEVFHLAGGKSERNLFLFENGLLIVKRKDDGTFSFKNYIAHSNLMLSEVISENPLQFSVIAFDNPKVLTVIEAKNIDQKRVWTSRLKTMMLKKFGVSIPEHVQQLVMQLGEVQQGVPVESSPRRFRPNFFHTPAVPEYLNRRLAKSPARDHINATKPDNRLPRQNRRKTAPTLEVPGTVQTLTEIDLQDNQLGDSARLPKPAAKAKTKTSTSIHVSTDYIPRMKEDEFMYEEIRITDEHSSDDASRRKSAPALESSFETISPRRKPRQKSSDNSSPESIGISDTLKTGFWNAFNKAKQVLTYNTKPFTTEELAQTSHSTNTSPVEVRKDIDPDDLLDLDSFTEAVNALTIRPICDDTHSSDGFYERSLDLLDSISGGGDSLTAHSDKEDWLTNSTASPSPVEHARLRRTSVEGEEEFGRRTGVSIKRKGAFKKRPSMPRTKSAPSTPQVTEKLSLSKQPKEPSTLIQQKIRSLEKQAFWQSTGSVDREFKANDAGGRKLSLAPLARSDKETGASSLSLDARKDNYVTMMVNKIESASDLKLS